MYMNQSHRLKNKTRYNKIPKFTKSLSFPKFTRKNKSKYPSFFPEGRESTFGAPLLGAKGALEIPQYVLVPPPPNTHIDFDARRIDPIKNAGKSEIILLFIMHGQDLKTNLDEKLKENTLMFSMAQPGGASSMSCFYNVESKSNVTGVSPYFIKKHLTKKLHNGNRSVVDVNGGLLVVSQFTLAADLSGGNRPSFTQAAAPAEGQRLYDYFVTEAREAHPIVQTGQFAADMKVHLVNDGPVTIPLHI
jgi:D-Tyr-tRNAtyr deacylase